MSGGIALRAFDRELSVCRLKDAAGVNLSADFCFFARADGETSLVCPSDSVPENAEKADGGWMAMRVAGTLDFSLTGILAGISSVLAANGIGIFAVSTYDTDYILTKKENFGKALDCLEKAGYGIRR